MKIIKKIIAAILLAFVLLITGIFIYLYYLDSTLYDNLPREFRTEKTYKNHTFTIVFEVSPMSFGSGHKVLILKNTATGENIDEVYFGEHPLTIKNINSKNIDLIIPNSGYANSWCQKNNKISKYEIKCVYN